MSSTSETIKYLHAQFAGKNRVKRSPRVYLQNPHYPTGRDVGLEAVLDRRFRAARRGAARVGWTAVCALSGGGSRCGEFIACHLRRVNSQGRGACKMSVASRRGRRRAAPRHATSLRSPAAAALAGGYPPRVLRFRRHYSLRTADGAAFHLFGRLDQGRRGAKQLHSAQ
ncbi:hypothetical protein R5R35_005005 [Gryllus longicercus]|uniref:Uncharacterized protein n=1 Tax=Gryllus longicercus TaxID=2509291 RepID=A0AAN9VNF9_9ORTH